MIKWLGVLFFLTGCGLQSQVTAIKLNNEGVDLLKSDSPTGAQQNFVDALATLPFESRVHNNLGVSFDEAKEVDKAISSYLSAQKHAQKSEDAFLSAFNLGQAYAKKGQIPLALEWYQKALAVYPASKEVKTNIELLSQQNGGGGQGDNQQKNDKKDDGKNDQDDKNKKKDPQQYAQNQKPKPREFKGELSENDVKKILGELKQQEQRIRADYNRKEEKEQPHGKDW